MPDADSADADSAPEFRSPKRALARSFRLSRDRWKHKAAQRRQQIKALQIRVRDLETSRDLWKDKALHLTAQLQQLQGVTSPQPDDSVSAQTGQVDPAGSSPVPPSPPTGAGQAEPLPGDPLPATSAPAGSSAASEGPPPKKAPRARR